MKVLIVGGGNMGAAFARALLKQDICTPAELVIIEQDLGKAAILKDALGCTLTTLEQTNCLDQDLLILAVKPQDSKAILTRLAKILQNPSILIVSIMAGVSLHTLQDSFGKSAKLVRAMPNLPCQIGLGMTTYTTGELTLAAADEQRVEQVLSATGKVLKVASEDLIDAATALAGSGPAYVFYFIEALVAAGERRGFSPEESQLLVKQTFAGALELLEASGESAASLREKVTSKGGTTAAAIEVLDQHSCISAIAEAVKAAYKRAGELGA